MLLAIEQGNTNTLFAVHDRDTWIAKMARLRTKVLGAANG